MANDLEYQFNDETLSPWKKKIYQDAATAFQPFAAELLAEIHPRFQNYQTGGKDGAIDLVGQLEEGKLHVFECKYHSGEDFKSLLSRWKSEMEKRLEKNVQSPTQVGQSQYAPWINSKQPIVKYTLVTTYPLKHESERQEFIRAFQELFKTLVDRGLKHLDPLCDSANLDLVDANKISLLLAQHSIVALQWFRNKLPRGLSLHSDTAEQNTFRAYLESKTLPYYSLREHQEQFNSKEEEQDNPPTIPDESALLEKLGQGNCFGIIITGQGGYGKTRLTQELGKVAAGSSFGWSVLRVEETIEPDDLNELERIRSAKPILILFDYLEVLSNFESLIHTIERLKPNTTMPIYYVANCRSNYYDSSGLRHDPKHHHFHFNLSPSPSSTKEAWFSSYREATILHVLQQMGIAENAEILAVCKNIPILAVFLSFLQKNHGPAYLDDLKNEDQFGAWIFKRLQLSFGKNWSSQFNPKDLATLSGIFPCRPESYLQLPESAKALWNCLLKDGWIAEETIVLQSGNSEKRISMAHDVIADTIIEQHLKMMEENTIAIQSFLHDLLTLSASLQEVRSGLFTLQRLAGLDFSNEIDWTHLLNSHVGQYPKAWSSANEDLLRTSLLDVQGQMQLLIDHDQLWEGAETKQGFHNALGWLLRWHQYNPACTNNSMVSKLQEWTIKSIESGTMSTLLLNYGLQTFPTQIEGFILDYLSENAHLQGASFIICSWLKAIESPELITPHVNRWLLNHGRRLNAEFVFSSWLEAGGDIGTVKEAIQAWLKIHQETEEAHFVFTAWLDGGGEIDTIKEAIQAWLRIYQEAVEAPFVFKAWLDAGGEIEAIKEAIQAWLGIHQETVEAHFVFKAWLDAGGEIDVIKAAIQGWLRIHQETEEAHFVFKAWLNAGGEINLVTDEFKSWLTQNSTAKDADFVFKAWLDAGGEIGVVKGAIQAWLKKHQEKVEADFVFTAWLDAGGEIEAVKAAIQVWLTIHQKTVEARFVLKAWLNAGREISTIKEAIQAWLKIHQEKEEAPFVFKAWLDAGGEIDTIKAAIQAWLRIHQETEGAPFVFKAWLNAGGEIDTVKKATQAWLKIHQETEKAQFVLTAWLDAGGEIDTVKGAIQDWLKIHQETEEAPFIFKAWLNAGGEIEAVKEAVQAWLRIHKEKREAQFVFKAWLDAGGPFETIDSELVGWFQFHTDLEYSKYLISSVFENLPQEKVLVLSLLERLRSSIHNPKTLELLSFSFHFLRNSEFSSEICRTCASLFNHWLKQAELTLEQSKWIFKILYGLVYNPGLHGGRFQGLVDLMLAVWVRHPCSFAESMEVNKTFQGSTFIERVLDLVGGGELDVVRDRKALEKFILWFNRWDAKKREGLRVYFELHLEDDPDGPWKLAHFSPPLS